MESTWSSFVPFADFDKGEEEDFHFLPIANQDEKPAWLFFLSKVDL